jgi:hypothetical protein
MEGKQILQEYPAGACFRMTGMGGFENTGWLSVMKETDTCGFRFFRGIPLGYASE